MTKWRVIRNWDDHDPVVLGHVKGPTNVDWDNLWDEFQTTKPETDTEFINWLVKNRNFDFIADEFEDVCVGT